MKSLRSIGLLLALTVIVAGCSKSSSPTGSSGTSAPALTAPVFSGPDSSATADTSQAAIVAMGAAATFNAISSGYVALFTGLSATQSGNSWTWSHSYTTGGKWTWTATSTSNGYNWTLVENGTTPSGTYNNWTALSGYQSTDGKTGHWVIYSNGTTAVSDSVGWSTDVSGTVSGTIVIYNNSGVVNETMVYTSNKTTHTGTLVIYGGPALAPYKVWNIAWTSSGGTWTEYDPTNGGAVVGAGTW